MSLLADIVRHKKLEVLQKKEQSPITDVFSGLVNESNLFTKALREEGISMIAEIKRKSPSAGLIREDFNPVAIAQIYEKHGARALSILTDQKYFGGEDTTVLKVKEKSSLPVLRKEFIVDEYQIRESKILGAEAILLIVRILEQAELESFIQLAGELGLAALVEVHSQEELERALDTSAQLIGINNRDLDTLRIDLGTSIRLKKMIPGPVETVTESGIRTREDVLKLEAAGFDGFLIGETLMKSGDIGCKAHELLGIES